MRVAGMSFKAVTAKFQQDVVLIFSTNLAQFFSKYFKTRRLSEDEILFK